MSANPKHRTTTKSTLLLWMILVSPLVGLVTYMVATHNALDTVGALKLTAAVVATWWLISYAFTRWLHWRAHHRVRA